MAMTRNDLTKRFEVIEPPKLVPYKKFAGEQS